MTTAQQGVAALKAKRSWWSVITEWRNWRIPAKLVAVLLIPVVAAVVLGVLRISSEISRSHSYERIDGLVAVQAKLHELINDVQDERTFSAEFLGGTGVSDPAILVRQGNRVDTVATELRATIGSTLDSGLAAKYTDAANQFNALPALRQHVRSNTADAATSQAAYTAVIDALLGFDQTLVSQFGDPTLGSTASGVFAVLYAEEQIDQEHAIVAAGLGRGHFLPIELSTLRDTTVRLEDKLADVRVVATPAQLKLYNEVISSPVVAERHAMLGAILLAPADPAPPKRGKAVPPPVNPDDWNRVSNDSSQHIRQAEATVVGEMRSVSAAQQDQASNQAGLESVILLSALLLALTLLIMVGRGLLIPLSVLRRAALDVAERRLPAAVAKVRDGDVTDTTIEPVPIKTTEEVGQLARAVDAMHGQAVRLAAEQALLRKNLNTTFINVSRRSQSLVERLLRQLELLEKNEEDPDQLSNLFKLDHLATRMRRNNENLMVLSGNDLARRAAQPLGLGDVLRAATSEIEQYERVVVRPTPSVKIAGYVSGDLVRLLAELLDNAAQYSAPETQVTIATHQSVERNVIIEILDEGIGMSQDEIAKANVRLTEAGSADSGVSRQMGLFVVSKLAARHGVQVKLSGGDEGVLATVTLPEDVLVATTERAGGFDSTALTPPMPGRTNGSTTNQAMTGLFGQLGTPLPPLERDEPAATPPIESTGKWDAAELDEWTGPSVTPGNGAESTPLPTRSVPNPRDETGRGGDSMPDSFAPFESPFTGLSSVSSEATDLFKPVKDPSEAPDYQWDDGNAAAVYGGPSTVDDAPNVETTAGSAFGDYSPAQRPGAATDATSTGWFEAIAADPAAATSKMPDEWFGVENLADADEAQSPAAEAPPAGFANWDTGGRDSHAESRPSGLSASDWRSGDRTQNPDDDRADQRDAFSTGFNGAGAGGGAASAASAISAFRSDRNAAAKGNKKAESTSWNLTPATRPDAGPAEPPSTPRVVSTPAGGAPLPKRKPKKSAIGTAKPSSAEPAAPQPDSRPEPRETPVAKDPVAQAPLPERSPARSQPETPARGNPVPPSPETAPVQVQWSSPADAGWQAARELAAAQPASHTSAGLPRRVPKAHLLPGSAGPATTTASAPPNRNAADVRGRLNSLQSGIRDGRHRRAATPDEHRDNGQEGDRS